MELAMTLDAFDADAREQIEAAKRGLVELALTTPRRWWTAFDLKEEARNGWSAPTMDLALYDLVDEGRLEERHDHRLRARAAN
jgi:hypothetical protein